ncbi:MAG: BtpA/SgcQ family protein [Planctomycetes bacterium]|nr:BtpA/SgcQ family protein [Planctomycetota bacterium]
MAKRVSKKGERSGTPLPVIPPHALIGMVHVRALPGTPFARLGLDEIERIAVQEAMVLAGCGFDGIIIENMHDRPYVHGAHGPETTAGLTRIACAIRQRLPRMPMGVQVLSGGNKEALAIALAAGAQFIRCENFVFAHVADEGLLTRAEAGELLRFRKTIGAEHIQVWCDIKKKHASHAVTADISIGDVAEGARFFGADAVIVTGSATGKPADPRDLDRVKRATPEQRVFVGSGVSVDNVAEFLSRGNGVIVGSELKRGGVWSNDLEEKRCQRMADAVKQWRSSAAGGTR